MSAASTISTSLNSPRSPSSWNGYETLGFTTDFVGAGPRPDPDRHAVLCLTAPTGGGKTLCIFDMCRWGWPTVIYHNRSMLGEQYFTGADREGIDYGVQVAGYAAETWKDVQVASIQTVHSRWKAGKMYPFRAQLVIIDEIHNETGVRTQELMDWHLANGATAIVLVTATPLGIAHLGVERIVIAGSTSELRECGALVPCITYAPDEPDLRAFKNERANILQMREEVKEAMLPVIFGRVFPTTNYSIPTGNRRWDLPKGCRSRDTSRRSISSREFPRHILMPIAFGLTARRSRPIVPTAPCCGGRPRRVASKSLGIGS